MNCLHLNFKSATRASKVVQTASRIVVRDTIIIITRPSISIMATQLTVQTSLIAGVASTRMATSRAISRRLRFASPITTSSIVAVVAVQTTNQLKAVHPTSSSLVAAHHQLALISNQLAVAIVCSTRSTCSSSHSNRSKTTPLSHNRTELAAIFRGTTISSSGRVRTSRGRMWLAEVRPNLGATKLVYKWRKTSALTASLRRQEAGQIKMGVI